jgi:endonuclease
MQRFNVVIPKEDGGIELYPMKEWLRQHPDHIPSGLDATASTSHQLRSGLKKMGWSVEFLDDEVRLIMPGTIYLKENIDAVLGEDDGEMEEIGDTGASFTLEYQLRDFIAQNIDVIPVAGQKLHLYVDPTGRDGIEFPTAVGPIDILAADDSNAFFVFELKRGRSPDHAIGQLTRYMGWVKQTIGKENEVRGIIVAKKITENLRYAVTVIPNVSLFEYEVSFHLNPVLPK